MRIVVLGGVGNFGARICRALAPDPSLTVVAASRRRNAAPVDFALLNIHNAQIDITADGLLDALRALSPGLVIHCVGPFQGQDYRVAHATLSCGAHYIDLSDGRDFVASFGEALSDSARRANRLAVSGASTLPALSSAVVDALADEFSNLKSIDTVIAPAQRAPRGAATLGGVLGYAGQAFQVWEDSAWRTVHGWQDVQEVDLGVLGTRLSAVCDVPDLALFPKRYAGVATVRFRAALELGLQHRAIALLAALRRAGLNLSIARLAPRLETIASLLDSFGGETGGMTVTLAGIRQNGTPNKLRWHVIAPDNHGPEIPCMPAVLLARKLAAGTMNRTGAMPCMGLVTLNEFAAEFAKWGMRTQVEELH